MLFCLLALAIQIFGFPSHNIGRSDLDATLDLDEKITDQPVLVKFDRPDLAIPARFGRSNPPNPVRFGRSDQQPDDVPVRFGRSDDEELMTPIRFGRSDQMDISSRFGKTILGAIPGLEDLIIWCGLI